MNINEYIDSCKTTCTYTIISFVLIFIFILSPIKNFFFYSLFGKITILLVLGYAISKNIKNTFDFSKVTMNEEVITIKNTNLMCGAIFSVFLLVLFLTVLRSLFY